jgi:hypothetical protein
MHVPFVGHVWKPVDTAGGIFGLIRSNLVESGRIWSNLVGSDVSSGTSQRQDGRGCGLTFPKRVSCVSLVCMPYVEHELAAAGGGGEAPSRRQNGDDGRQCNMFIRPPQGKSCGVV